MHVKFANDTFENLHGLSLVSCYEKGNNVEACYESAEAGAQT